MLGLKRNVKMPLNKWLIPNDSLLYLILMKGVVKHGSPEAVLDHLQCDLVIWITSGPGPQPVVNRIQDCHHGSLVQAEL